MSIKNVLMEEFNSELEGLSKMDLGTDNYKITVDGVTRLADRIIEIEKLEIESRNRIKANEDELDLKLQQMKDEKQIQNTRTGIDLAKVVLGLGFAAWAFVASTNFEREGNLTTSGGRKALDQLLKFTRF